MPVTKSDMNLHQSLDVAFGYEHAIGGACTGIPDKETLEHIESRVEALCYGLEYIRNNANAKKRTAAEVIKETAPKQKEVEVKGRINKIKADYNKFELTFSQMLRRVNELPNKHLVFFFFMCLKHTIKALDKKLNNQINRAKTKVKTKITSAASKGVSKIRQHGPDFAKNIVIAVFCILSGLALSSVVKGNMEAAVFGTMFLSGIAMGRRYAVAPVQVEQIESKVVEEKKETLPESSKALLSSGISPKWEKFTDEYRNYPEVTLNGSKEAFQNDKIYAYVTRVGQSLHRGGGQQWMSDFYYDVRIGPRAYTSVPSKISNIEVGDIVELKSKNGMMQDRIEIMSIYRKRETGAVFSREDIDKAITEQKKRLAEFKARERKIYRAPNGEEIKVATIKAIRVEANPAAVKTIQAFYTIQYDDCYELPRNIVDVPGVFNSFVEVGSKVFTIRPSGVSGYLNIIGYANKNGDLHAVLTDYIQIVREIRQDLLI